MSGNVQLSVVILAAGKGTRMKSARAKVLHEVFFRPMIRHVIEAVQPLQPSRCIVVVGHQQEAVSLALQDYDVQLVRQERQLGTGHAVQMAEAAAPDGVVMILCGDTPLIRTASLTEMYKRHAAAGSVLTVMTTELDDPTGYGRIIADGDAVTAIVEEKDASEEQRHIREINAGIYLVERRLLFEALRSLTPDNSQGELYLTDIVKYAVARKMRAERFPIADAAEVLGVNSRVELEAAHRYLQRQRNIELMQQGVTIYDRDTVAVAPGVEIGADTILMPQVNITGESRIGQGCVIENGVILKDCVVEDKARIGAYSVLNKRYVDNGSEVPPLTRS